MGSMQVNTLGVEIKVFIPLATRKLFNWSRVFLDIKMASLLCTIIEKHPFSINPIKKLP